MVVATSDPHGYKTFMLVDGYVEALPVDSDLADEVWESWDQGLISDGLVA